MRIYLPIALVVFIPGFVVAGVLLDFDPLVLVSQCPKGRHIVVQRRVLGKLDAFGAGAIRLSPNMLAEHEPHSVRQERNTQRLW